MWLWVDRFFGSARVQQLGGFAQAVYLVLLAREWQLQGQGLPGDSEKLRRLVALEEADWAPIWGELRQFFDERRGRLYNRVLEETLGYRQGLQEARSEHARKAAQARWNQHAEGNASSNASSNARAMHQAMPEQCHPSPSPSPREETPTTSENYSSACAQGDRETRLKRIRELRQKALEENRLDQDFTQMGEAIDGLGMDEGRRAGADGAVPE